MIELFIGVPIKDISALQIESDLFRGLSRLEKDRSKLVAINLGGMKLVAEDVDRIITVLLRSKTPTIIISDDEIMAQYDRLEHIEVISSKHLDELFEESVQKLEKLNSLDKQITKISTQRRGVAFYLLSGLLILEPLIKTAYLKYTTGFSYETVFGIILSIESPIKIFEYWVLFPLAGLALARTAWWSIFVFVGTHLYSLYAHIVYDEFSWPYVQETPHISSNLLLVLNSAILLYFLIPEHRRPFIKKAKEVFRANERVKLDCQVQVFVGERKFSATLVDISQGGALLSTKESLSIGDVVEIELKELDGPYKALVVRNVESEGEEKLFGLKFEFAKRSQRKNLSGYVDEVKTA